VSELNLPSKIFIIVFIIGIVLFLSFLFFGFKKEVPVNVVEYNYHSFEEVGGLWQTTITLGNQPYEAMFRFNPSQVEDVYVVGDFSGFKSPVDVSFDPLSAVHTPDQLT